jgi:hypothetical protein
MAEYIQLPDGSYLQLKEGQSPLEGMVAARQAFPELFAKKEPEVKRDTKGFKAAAAAGLESLGGEFELLKGKLGLKDQAEAQREYEAAQQRAKERFTPTEEGWTESPWQKLKETAGGSLPYMVAPAAAGLAALAAPVAAPTAAIIGAGAAGLTSAAQFTGTNLARQMDTGKSLEEASLGKAFAAAVPQAAIDTAAMALLPGVGKLFGSVGSKLTTDQARAIASQTLGKAVMDYTAKTGAAMGREGLTETTQQVLERLQAGLDIADPEARKEYIDSFIGGAALAGVGAPVGRYMERSAAKEQAATADAADKAAAAKALKLQQEQQRQAEEAEKNTPEYALRIADEYAAAQQQHDELKASIHKGAKNKHLTEEQKAFNREVNRQLYELGPTLKELGAEKNRVTQSGLLAQAQEEQRRASMSPMDYLLEQTGEVPESEFTPTAPDMAGLEFPEPITPTMRREADAAQQAQIPAAYAAERVQLVQDQVVDPTGDDYVAYLLQDPYKAALVVETKTPLPGMTDSQSNMIRNAVGRQLKALSKDELTQRQAALKEQTTGKEQANPLAQFLADQDMLDVARQEGMTESEIAQVEKLAKMPTAVVDQGELFPSEQRVGQSAGVSLSTQLSDKLGELQRQLDIAKAQRNTDRGGQYQETIRSIREQIGDILSRAPLQTIGGLGQQTAELQGMLGQAPEAMRKQQEAQVAREQQLTKLAAGEDTRFDILDGLVNEIKSVRGDFKPETITAIEREAAPLLDVVGKYGEGYAADVAAELGAIAQKWRAGTESTQTVTRTATPTQTTEGMLRTQLEQAYANRDRYDADTMGVLDRIADNLGAVMVDPERRNLIGEWLHNATVQSRQGRMTVGPQQRAASPLQREVVAELDRLEGGKLQENGQLELSERFMPKAVAPQSETRVVDGKVQFVQPEDVGPLQGSPAERYTPAKKAEAFATAAEFQKFLASEGLQMLRSSMGMVTSTAARMHQRMEVYRKKYEGIIASAQKQLDALNKRKAELQASKTQEDRTAKELLADAQIRLNNVIDRLQAELQDLQVVYIQADLQRAASAREAADVAAQIAANVIEFDATNVRAIEASQAAAAAKAELAKIMQMPVNKKTFSAMRKAQQAVTEAVREQRSASASLSPALKRFLAEDEKLQLQLTEANEKAEADARTLVEAKAALDAEAARQKRRLIYKQEFKTAQAGLAAALELSGPELAKITGSIEAELGKIETDLAAATAEKRVAEGKLAPKEAPKSAFEQKLAEVKVEPLARAERDAIAARDKAELENFQAKTARLEAVPGMRVSFDKRREMLLLVDDNKKTRADFDARIQDHETGIEELQIAAAVAEDGIADAEALIAETNAAPAPAPIYAERDAQQRAATIAGAQKAIAGFKEKLKTANDRLGVLQKGLNQLQAQKIKFEQAYEKAVLATSSDPEVYAKVTEDIDARIEKLNKNIKENTERLQKREAKSGEKAAGKTLRQARKRTVQYKRELKRLEELRSNRLGIQRFNAVTGEKVSDRILVKQGKTVPQKTADLATQEAIDAENERAEQYSERTGRLIELQNAQAKLEAAAQPKTKAKQEERAEKLRKLQEDINKQIDLVNEVRPKGVGKVSAAARIQTSAPGKFRTGTAESKDATGVTKQPIVEKRAVAQPTATKAVEEANEFAERLEKAKTDQQREDLILAKSLEERQQIVDAINDNVLRMRNRIAALEAERKTLQGAKGVAANDRLAQINKELDGTPVDIQDVETTGLRTLLKSAERQLQKVAAEITKANEVEADRAFEMLGTDMGAVEPVDDYDMGDVAYRTTTKTGPSMLAQAVERLAKRIMEGWKNAPEVVVVNTERDLPVRILNQVERDNMWGRLPGLYDPKSKKVYLVASNLRDATDVIATVAHEAAGHFGLQTMLGNAYSNMMRSIYANNSDVRKKAKAKMQANANLSQDVAVEEVLADMAEGDLSPVERNIMQRVYDMVRNFFRKMLGKDAVMTDNQVRQIVANARRFVIEGGVAGEGKAQTGEALYRTAKETNALTELSRKVVAPDKSFAEQLKDVKALELEMSGVDARAALERMLKNYAANTGEMNDYTQAMYLIRKSDDMLSQARVNMENGSLELFRDAKGLLGVRSSGKNSAAPVFKAVGKIPDRFAPTAQDKYALATTYAAAKRVANKGLQKLDTGALGLDEAEMKAALAAANADPELKSALEEFSDKYNDYNQGLVQFLAESGAISQKLAKELLANGDYVPFYRVRADGKADLVFSDKMVFTIGDIRHQPYLAELKGDDTKIMPLNESLPRNTMLLVDKALTNLAQRNLAYAMQDIGRGKGPIDPKTGKPKNLMVIHKESEKSSPDDNRVIRFNQEPDPRDPKDDGRRWVMVEANGTDIEGVPAELVVRSLEGASMALPGFLKLAGAASDLLRTGVTRMPLYIARQLYKEPMAATFTGGLNYSPFRAVLEAGKEYIRMMRGKSETQAALIEKGLVQSQIFSGSPNDIKKIALQLAEGADQSTLNKVFAGLDRAAINADSATRALVYKNALANGLSEVEAEHMARESMNFSKRGSSATVQYASRLIPFMNAQIQGLNVLYKAMTGKMPYNEQLRIKRKFMNNAMLLFATGIGYAMAMEDDEYFKNARPRDKYTNFFLHLPGVEEPIKVATPFEAGYFFSLAVAAVDGMKAETNNAEQFRALRDMFLSSVPGYSSMGMPQLVKPAFEVWTNKNFMSGAPIESLRMQNLEVQDRYNESTTELAKAMSRAIPVLSPIQIEHIVKGYLGMAPIAAAAMINGAVPSAERGERPTAKASETPFFGAAFQRKMGGAQADEVYRLAEDAFQARTTLGNRIKEGRKEEAKEFREERKVELAMATQAGQYKQLVGRINADIRRTQNRTDLTGDEKRARLDKLDQAKLDAANRFLEAYRKTEARLGD